MLSEGGLRAHQPLVSCWAINRYNLGNKHKSEKNRSESEMRVSDENLTQTHTVVKKNFDSYVYLPL